MVYTDLPDQKPALIFSSAGRRNHQKGKRANAQARSTFTVVTASTTRGINNVLQELTVLMIRQWLSDRPSPRRRMEQDEHQRRFLAFLLDEADPQKAYLLRVSRDTCGPS